MKPLTRTWVAPALAALVLGGCSLLLRFDEQSCDDRGRCKEGFACVGGVCLPDSSGGCQCPPGQGCAPGTTTCVSCEQLHCPAGYVCSTATGSPICDAIRWPALGSLCSYDSECAGAGQDRFCMRGAVQLAAAGGPPRTSVCVERCSNGACLTAGVECRSFPAGLDAGPPVGLCLPPEVLRACKTDADCPGELICTVFDHPQVGPVLACDGKLVGGAPVGQPCVQRITATMRNLCSTGLCVPQTAQAPSICATPCDELTCPAGESCRLVEFGNPIRHLPMCVVGSVSAVGRSCSSDSECAPDAPHCTNLTCAQKILCLSGCAAGAVGFPACPPDQECRAVEADAGRCVPQGLCP